MRRPETPSQRDCLRGSSWKAAERAVIVVLLLFAPNFALASWESEHLIRVWQTEDGLPQNSVIAIAQTRDGYLWFGTFNGLARFDGTRFEVFDPSNCPLNSRAIQALHGDSHGRLWILTVERDMFVLIDGAMARVAFEGNARPVFSGSRPVLETPEGELLAVTSAGLARWDGRQFADATEQFGLQRGRRLTVAVSGDKVWAASGPHVGMLAGGKFKERFDLGTLGGESVLLMASADRGNGLWITYDAKNRVYSVRARVDASTGRVSTEGPPMEGELWCIMEDRERTLWAGSNGYGLVVKPDGGAATNLTTRHGLSHNQVRSAFEDREGNIWLGTDGGGVMRVKKRLFQVFDRSAGFVDEVIYSVAPRENGLEVATYSSGFYRFNPSTGLASRYLPERPTGRAVLADRAGTLWAGTYGDGLFRNHSGSWEPVALPPAAEKPSASCLFEDRSGALWVGGPFGLAIWDGGKLRPVRLGAPKDRRAPTVSALAEDGEGTIWAATREDGLFAIRKANARQYTKRDGLPSERLLSLLATEDGLWVGTEDHGLARFAAERFFEFGIRNGLSAGAVCWMIEDAQRRLWIGSYRGVHVTAMDDLDAFAAGKGTFVRSFAFGLEDGLKALESVPGSQPGVCRTVDGRIWFATIKGLASVDPARVKPGAEPPPVQIEEVSVDRKVVYANSPWTDKHRGANAGRITLPASYRVLEIRYTGLNFGAPEQVQFRHKMGGSDRDWSMADRKRIATYPKLPPGEHRFAVTAALRDGPWSVEEASIMVHVLPHWWETIWFRGGAVAALAGLAGAAMRWNTRRAVRQALEEAARRQAISDERARISRDMHDGLGSKLTQVSLLARALDEAEPKASGTREAASRISSISHELLQSMSEVVWAVDPKHDNLEDLAEHMVSFAQEHLSLAGIRCEIEVPTAVPHLSLSPKWRHQVLMVFKEAVQNAVKHSKANRVRVRMEMRGSNVHLEIEDDGKGLCEDGRRGHGLENMRERIESMSGEISIESGPGPGTRVRFSVPLHESV